MIESYLTSEMVVQGEPALDDYLRSTQTDFDDIKQESFGDLLKDLIDQNLKLKKLCTPLSLNTSVTKTAAFNSTLSDEDFAQRLRLVIKVTAITGDAVFTLQGTDDAGVNYTSISIVDNDVSSATSHTISAIGTYSYSLTNLYDKYRLQLISIGTTITYSAYLIEEAYTTMHREKTRMKIFGSLIANGGDVWESKYKYYEQSYLGMIATTKFTYDSDESGDIGEDEGEGNINQTIDFVV